jgi:hypothetical protein
VKLCALTPKVRQYYRLKLHLATTIAVQVEDILGGTRKRLMGYVKLKLYSFVITLDNQDRFRISHRRPGREDIRLTSKNRINN